MKILKLNLKRRWFEMIKCGYKQEEYREMSWYWHQRLYEKGDFTFKKFDKITFKLGYPKNSDTEKILTFKNPIIRIGYGKEEWGAEKYRQYFIITWNNQIKQHEFDFPIMKIHLTSEQIQKIKEFKK